MGHRSFVNPCLIIRQRRRRNQFLKVKIARRGRGRDPHPCSAASMINPAPAPVIGSISHPSLAVVPQRHAGSGGQNTPEWRFRAAISKWDSTPIRGSLRSPHGPYAPVLPCSADVNDAAPVREPTARLPNPALRPSNPLLEVSAADAHPRWALPARMNGAGPFRLTDSRPIQSKAGGAGRVGRRGRGLRGRPSEPLHVPQRPMQNPQAATASGSDRGHRAQFLKFAPLSIRPQPTDFLRKKKLFEKSLKKLAKKLAPPHLRHNVEKAFPTHGPLGRRREATGGEAPGLLRRRPAPWARKGFGPVRAQAHCAPPAPMVKALGARREPVRAKPPDRNEGGRLIEETNQC